jgi:hypothetical protein
MAIKQIKVKDKEGSKLQPKGKFVKARPFKKKK